MVSLEQRSLSKMHAACRRHAYLAVLLTVSLCLVSCSPTGTGTSTQDYIADGAPAYCRETAKLFEKQAVSFRYDPQTLPSIPEASKEYEIPVRDIPSTWVRGQLTWYLGPGSRQEQDQTLFDGFCCGSCNYLLESAIDPTYKPPSSPPGAQFPFRAKRILKLYRRKDVSSLLPDHLTNADYTLVKTLDGVTEQGRAPQNQLAGSSTDFIIWSASADDAGEQWTLWSCDVRTGASTALYSSKDATKSGMIVWISAIVPERNLWLIDLQKPSTTGTSGHRLIVIDLASGKVVKTLDEPAGSGFLVIRQGVPVHVIGNCIYLERERSYTSSEATIIRLNLANWKEEVVLPASPFHVMASSQDGKLVLVPSLEQYQYHDIWIWDLERKTMTCPFRVQLQAPEISGQAQPAPYVSLCPAGVFYANNGPSINAQRATFYDFHEEKARLTGPRIATNIDGQGTFLVEKQLYDIYGQTPSFDYPGKAQKLAGYRTMLIVRPDGA